MLQLKLKIDHNINQYGGQRSHTVECNGEVAGTLYDNRNCESQKTNFVFYPYSSRIAGAFSVELGSEERSYLLHAEGVKSNEMAEALDMVRDWAETIEARVTAMRDKFRKVLDAIPERPFKKSSTAEGYDGVLAKVLLGSKESFMMELTWAELAKMYGSSYGECSEYQVTGCGVNGEDYGIKWSHMRASKTIQANAYSGANMISIERSEAHISGL